MKPLKILGALGLAASVLAASATAQAKDLAIGLVMPMSGPFAAHGKQLKHGIELYLAAHDNTLGGRKVKLIVKDDTGIAPAVAKRLAQELIIKDKVDILAGFTLTPNAFSVAPLATEAKVPMVVLNAATSSITEKSPNIVRVSMTLPQDTAPLAQWAHANGIRRSTPWWPTTAPATTPSSSSRKPSPAWAARSWARYAPPSPRPTTRPSCSASRTPGPTPSFCSCPTASPAWRWPRATPSAAWPPPASRPWPPVM
jgi:hypothetical protein